MIYFLGTFFTNLIGRALFRLNYEQERREADFRYGLACIRDHVESIAFYQSELNERASLSTLYFKLMSNSYRIIDREYALNWFTRLCTMAAIIIPYLVSFQKYFSGKLEWGDLSLTLTAFNNVYQAFSFIPNEYGTIVLWRASAKRLIDFDNILNELYAAKNNSKIKHIYLINIPTVQVKNLVVELPLKVGEDSAKVLIKDLNLVFESYQAILITGNEHI